MSAHNPHSDPMNGGERPMEIRLALNNARRKGLVTHFRVTNDGIHP